MNDPEDFCEQLSRVKMMIEDDGDTWDLSPNDKAALVALLDSHQLHFDRANALEAENRSLAAEVVALMRRTSPASSAPAGQLPNDEVKYVCGESAPDCSGRSCDKPKGHSGVHWTYGGACLAWEAGHPPTEAQKDDAAR